MELSEKDMENLIASNPDKFIEPGIKLIGRQVYRSGRRFDLLFQDKFGRLLLVEIKKGVITRDAVGQIMEYYGLLKQSEQSPIELMLIGNVISTERRSALEHAGIVVKEIPLSVFKSEMGIIEALEVNIPKKTIQASPPFKDYPDTKIALIGGTIDKYIKLNYEYYETNGEHWDGWTYKNIQRIEHKLRSQISEDGYFLLYGYHSKKDGGDGNIKWKMKVSDLVVFDKREWFTDSVLGLSPNDRYYRFLVYSNFLYQSLEQVNIKIDGLYDIDKNRYLNSKDGSRLLNSFIVVGQN